MSRRFASMVLSVLACGLLVASSLGAREAAPSVGTQGIDPGGLAQGIGHHIDPNGLTQGIGFHIDPNGLMQGIGFHIDPNGLTQGIGHYIDPNGLTPGQMSSGYRAQRQARQSIRGQ